MLDRQERRPNLWADQIDDAETKQYTPDPFARREDRKPKEKPNPTRLSSSVGEAGTNARRDVAKVEKMLGATGDLDLKQTDGPTGYWGMRTSEATKRFQKKNKLKVDAQINPAGPTLKKLGETLTAKVQQAQKSATPKASQPVVLAKAGTQGSLDSRLPNEHRTLNQVQGDVVERDRTPHLTADAVSANGRAARYLASRRGIGDYPTFVAAGIEMNPEQGIAEATDLIEQTRAKSPEQAEELFKKTLDGLSEANAERLREIMQDTDGSESLSMDGAPPDQDVPWQKKLDEIDAVYKRDGAQGLIDTYGPAVRQRLEDLYAYATDPKNEDDVRKQAFEIAARKAAIAAAARETADAGLAAVLGSVVSTRAKQGKAAIKAAKGAKPAQSVHMASEKANLYDGPTVDRPFEKDYPHGAQTDADGNLTHDIDGRPLDPRGRIVGRRIDGVRDHAASGSELDAIAEEGTGRVVEKATRADLEGDFGGTSYSGVTRKPDQVVIRDDLRGAEMESVLGHEVGHVIDQYAGEIPVPKDIRSELDDLFNTLNNPKRDDLNPDYADIWSKPVTPLDQGYAPKDVERELMAEAIRGYLVNPAYVKEAAPNVAKHIRKWVNEHPELRKIVQFNAVPGAILLGTPSDQALEE